MTLVVSDTLPPNRTPPEAGVVPILLALGKRRPSVPNPAPRAAVERTEERDLLPSYFPNSGSIQSTGRTHGRRVQSSADLVSIEPGAVTGFSRLLCPFGNSGKKATGCETAGFVAHARLERRPTNRGVSDQRADPLSCRFRRRTQPVRPRRSAMPLRIMSMFRGARGDTSISSERLTGPRSLILAMTERPFRKLVTRTSECSGSERCAAVACTASSRSPLAVRRPT